MDQPGKVANPARGQLNRENNIPLSPCVPENYSTADEPQRARYQPTYCCNVAILPVVTKDL